MMSVMGLLRFILLLSLAACAHRAGRSERSPETLIPMMSLVGEGKARLEIGPESWVFSFDANFTTPDTWLMGLVIPTQGEMVFSFPGLGQAQASVTPSADDLRWRIVHALEVTSKQRKLGYPEAGQDFIQGLHHLLRWVRPGSRPAHVCHEVSDHNWKCEQDKQVSSWIWLEKKEELRVIQNLRPDWDMVATFKNLQGAAFKRVTLEIIRKGEQKDFVELRQELFFSTP